MLENYFRCTLFDKKQINYSLDSYIQEELMLQTLNKNANFKIHKVLYTFKYIESSNFNNTKPALLLPIKDNIDLLEYTLDNLKQFNVLNITNVVVIDDRSEQNLLDICNKYQVNYLRVENNKGFNFSTINNIAAKIMFEKKIQEIILWNSDLWASDAETLSKLLKLHKDNNCTISGTKLLYPTFDWKNEISHTITSVYPDKINNYKKSIDNIEIQIQSTESKIKEITEENQQKSTLDEFFDKRV